MDEVFAKKTCKKTLTDHIDMAEGHREKEPEKKPIWKMKVLYRNVF